jgi:hypothetical protein
MADDERDDEERGGGDVAERAREQGQEVEEAKEEMQRLEEGDPPENLEDWPDGRAKYLTYGGPEGTAGYDEGPTAKLGPSSLEHREDGSVAIEGDEVGNPEDFKADEPVSGAPQIAQEGGDGESSNGDGEHAQEDDGDDAQEDEGGEAPDGDAWPDRG